MRELVSEESFRNQIFSYFTFYTNMENSGPLHNIFGIDV